MSQRVVHPCLSAQDITTRIEQLAQEITTEYKGKNVMLVGILKGAFMFMSDLSKALYQAGLDDFEMDFMGISSYGSDTETSRNPRITKDLDNDVANRHVLIIEDIIDTGHSLDALHRFFLQRQVLSLKTCVLLSKQSRREKDVPVEFIGFEVDGWIEGYGLDSDELHRGRPEIVTIEMRE